MAGTIAELTIETDRPLKNGEILMDDGKRIALESKDGNFASAKVPVEKDGMFHFAATEKGESVRLKRGLLYRSPSGSGAHGKDRHAQRRCQSQPHRRSHRHRGSL